MKLYILIKENCRKARNSSVRAWLFGLHFLLGRSLRVKVISVPDPIIFSGNYFSIQWQTTGCYKIVVNGSLILPGNITKIHMIAGANPFSLMLHFFGRREGIKKTYWVDPVVVESKKNMQVSLRAEWLKALAIKRYAGNMPAAKINKIDLYATSLPNLNIESFFRTTIRIIKEQHVHLEPFYLQTNNQLYPNP